MSAIQQALLWYWESAPLLTYATRNPSDKNANITLSWGDLIATGKAGNVYSARATIWKSTGKWYWEITIWSWTWTYWWIWIANSSLAVTTNWERAWRTTNWRCYRNDPYKFHNSAAVVYWTSFAPWDIIWVALDMDLWTIQYYKNNSAQWIAYSGLTGTLYPAIGMWYLTNVTANFWATTMAYTAPSWYNQGLYS
jgi:hypothetical protein